MARAWLMISAGVEFLEMLEPQIVFAGNHEDRIPKLQGHSNSIISYAADQVALELEKVIRSLGLTMCPTTSRADGGRLATPVSGMAICSARTPSGTTQSS